MAPLNRRATLEDRAISIGVVPARTDIPDRAALGRQRQTALPRGRHLLDHVRCADALTGHHVVVDHQAEVLTDRRAVYKSPSLDSAFLRITFATDNDPVVLREFGGVALRIGPQNVGEQRL